MRLLAFEGEVEAFGRKIDVSYDASGLTLQGITKAEADKVIRALEGSMGPRVLPIDNRIEGEE